MECPRPHLLVIRLKDDAAMIRPIALERHDEPLKGFFLFVCLVRHLGLTWIEIDAVAPENAVTVKAGHVWFAWP